eukprot:563843_1
MAHLSSLTRLLVLVLLFPNRSGIIPDSTVSTTWTELNASLPNVVKWPIGGYCDITQKIWIFGGCSAGCYKSVLSFDPNMPSAVVQHSDALNEFPWYQRGGISDGRFYFNSPSSPFISLFFTTNISFVYQFAQHIKGYTDFEILPWTINTDTVLFVLGAPGTNETYILNTSSSNWHQAADYSVSILLNTGYPARAIIVNTHLYRVGFYEMQHLDITGSIQDIVSRKWQKSPINDLDDRTNSLNSFYNTYSRNYELWAWGGYGPSYQMEGIRIVNTKTFEVTHVATAYDPWIGEADALTAYVPYKDAWYVIGGHWGYDRDSIYYVAYSAPCEPTQAPLFCLTSTPTGIPTNGPTSNPIPTSGPTSNPTSAPTGIPTNGPTSNQPTNGPTSDPSTNPSFVPTDGITITTAASRTSISKAGDDGTADPYLSIVLSALLSAVITGCIIYLIQKWCNRKTNDKADNSDPPPRTNVDQIVVNLKINEPKDAEPAKDEVAVDDNEDESRSVDNVHAGNGPRIAAPNDVAADHRIEPEPGSVPQENVMDDLHIQPSGNGKNENNDVEGEGEGEGACDQNDESQSYNDLYLEQKTEKDYDDDNRFDEAVRNAFVSK